MIMNRISRFLLLFFIGCIGQVGSVVLASFPLTATDGELFTLICRNITTGKQDIEWERDGEIVFTTAQGYARPSAFNKNLSSKRVNASCDSTHHNVTLRINSTLDNGSMWQCTDKVHSQKSNNMTINVTQLQTTLASTSTRSTSFPTTGTIEISSSGTTDVTQLQTTFAATSTRSTSFPTTGTIEISSSGTTGQDNTIGIAAGAVGGGVAVIAVVITVAVCIRKRRRSVEDDVRDERRRDKVPSGRAAVLSESGVSEVEEIVMQDNLLYTSSLDVAPVDYKIQDHNPVVKDVYAQVKKVKAPAGQHTVTDVYATPNKKGKETFDTDGYTKVNKVKKPASDNPQDTSENIEDMYSKPQKNKQNQQR
ncbi:uncharacterized protein LOC124122802 [Haliotis rufescens]|uniref:uncharacterized protein LOC124122802 n=1 Tax=Haliotis rufescens TaxID=6454 RepID=UPI00201EF8C8|nr:uncharacterized protein LOC124122802 [Haliotis rufescens]